MRYEKEVNYIIHLINCSMKNLQPENPSDKLDWRVINLLVRQQRIASTLYFALSKLPAQILQKLPNWDSYILAYKHALVDDSNRAYDIESLKKLFDENSIDYILLKGSVTKYLYPDSCMRPMSDIDILYRNASTETITELFNHAGYAIEKKDPGEITFYKTANSIRVEMQRELVDRGYLKWYEYLRDSWSRFNRISSYEYTMSDEDFYIYHFIHMAKHFRNGGVGINQLLDIYVMNSSYKELDFSYIESQLDLLGLRKFYENIELLLDVWFDDKKISEYDTQTVMLLCEYIFRNGAFGQKSQVEINIAIGDHREKISFFRKIFPDYNTMNSYYGGALSRFPWLLPAYWIRINFKRIFISGKSSRDVYKSISNINEKRIDKTKELMKRCNFDMNI